MSVTEFSLTGVQRYSQKRKLLKDASLTPVLVFDTVARVNEFMPSLESESGTRLIEAKPVHLPFRYDFSYTDIRGFAPDLLRCARRILRLQPSALLLHSFLPTVASSTHVDEVASELDPLAEAAAQADTFLIIENTFEASPRPVFELADRLAASIVLDLPRAKRFSEHSMDDWLIADPDAVVGLHIYGANGLELDEHSGLAEADRYWLDTALRQIESQPPLLFFDVPRESLIASTELVRQWRSATRTVSFDDRTI